MWKEDCSGAVYAFPPSPLSHQEVIDAFEVVLFTTTRCTVVLQTLITYKDDIFKNIFERFSLKMSIFCNIYVVDKINN